MVTKGEKLNYNTYSNCSEEENVQIFTLLSIKLNALQFNSALSFMRLKPIMINHLIT